MKMSKKGRVKNPNLRIHFPTMGVGGLREHIYFNPSLPTTVYNQLSILSISSRKE